MNKIKNMIKNLTSSIQTFYSTNRTQKLAVSVVVTTVVAGVVAFTLLYTPIFSPLMSDTVPKDTTITKDAEKDKLVTDKEKSSDTEKKDESEADDTKEKVQEETNMDANENRVAPENKPSTASTENTPASNQNTSAPVHEHDWVPNMVTIPGQAPQWKDTITPGSTFDQGYYTWPDGCKVIASDYGANLGRGGSTEAQAEHTAKHGEMEIGWTTETVTIPGKVEHVLIKEEIPEHQEQHGWKCSCGATKE